jgi:hypothetical protein
MSVPSGSELALPFLPAKDFGLSKRFYETIGFEKPLDGDVAIFRWLDLNTSESQTALH